MIPIRNGYPQNPLIHRFIPMKTSFCVCGVPHFQKRPKIVFLAKKKVISPIPIYILYKPELDHMVSRSYKPQATQKSEHLSS